MPGVSARLGTRLCAFYRVTEQKRHDKSDFEPADDTSSRIEFA